MTCPHCGASVPPGSSFCGACNRPLPRAAAAQGVPDEPIGRPGIVTLIAFVDFATTVLALIGAGLLAWGAVTEPSQRIGLGVAALACALCALLHAVAGVGLLLLKPFGRLLQIVLSGLSFCGLLPILVVVYLVRPGVRLLFSGKPETSFSPQESVLVRRDTGFGSGGTVAVVGVVLGAFLLVPVLVAVIGIVAAISIPALLRARVSANEAAAKGDARTMVSAQVTYSMSNQGFYEGRIECLVDPATCLPGYSGPAMLDASFTSSIRQGYSRRLIPGPPAPERQAGSSESSVSSFVFVLEPLTAGQTGSMAYCTDQSGLVCQTRAYGRDPFGELDGSGCPTPCDPL